MSLHSSWYSRTTSHATAAFSGSPDEIWEQQAEKV